MTASLISFWVKQADINESVQGLWMVRSTSAASFVGNFCLICCSPMCNTRQRVKVCRKSFWGLVFQDKLQQISLHLFSFFFNFHHEPVIMLISAWLTKESFVSKNCSCKADNKKWKTFGKSKSLVVKAFGRWSVSLLKRLKTHTHTHTKEAERSMWSHWQKRFVYDGWQPFWREDNGGQDKNAKVDWTVTVAVLSSRRRKLNM